MKILSTRVFFPLCVSLFWGGGRKHPQAMWFSHRTQYIVILVAIIYYNDSTRSKISSGESAWRRSRGNQAQAFRNPAPVESHRHTELLQQNLWQHMWNVVFQGTSLETVCPEVVTGGTVLIPSSQTLAKGQSSKQAFLRKAVSTLLCQLFSGPRRTTLFVFGGWGA